MIRGFVAGAAWGCAVAGLGLVVISQVAPRPWQQVDAGAALPVQAAIAETPAAEGPTVVPAGDPPVVQPLADTAPNPAAPVLPADVIAASEPPSALPGAEILAQPDLPVLGAPADVGEPSALKAPEALPAGNPVTADAPLPVPQEVLLEPAPAPLADPAPARVALEEGSIALPSPLPATELPSPDQAPVLPIAKPLPLPLPEPIVEFAPAQDPVPVSPEPALIEEPATVLQPVAPIVTAQESRTLAPDPGLPAVDGVTLGQLPKIGAVDVPAVEQAVLAPAADALPMQRFARAFTNADAKPLFAVLLRDTGEADLDRAALAEISFPVTFVIDPLSLGAADAAAIYRAAGQEVLMLANGIPDGATPGDIEQSLQSMASVLPESVGLIDRDAGGFQGNRPLAAQVVQILSAQGRGVVTFDTGLNAADQEAQRAALPSAVIFRRLDGDAETGPTIRRYLDRAAFKAAQEGKVVVLGDTRSETVAALLEWAVEGRAASVALSPVTAVMAAP